MMSTVRRVAVLLLALISGTGALQKQGSQVALKTKASKLKLADQVDLDRHDAIHLSCATLGKDTARETEQLVKAVAGFCENEQFKDVIDAWVDPKFQKNYEKLYGKDGWIDEAYVAYFSLKKAEIEEQMKWLITSVHDNSDRPVIAFNFGEKGTDWTPEQFPRLVVLRSPDVSRHMIPFNFNKFRSMLLSKVRTGIMLDSDEFVAPAADRLFRRVREEITADYPYPILPVHWFSRDPDPKFPNHPYQVYDFTCNGCAERTQRWNHAHPTFTEHALPFLGSWLMKVLKHEKYGDHLLHHWEDEDVLNVALWDAGVSKQWCKFDVPFVSEFFKYLKADARSIQKWPDPKWFPEGIPVAFYTAHHAVNPGESQEVLHQFNADGPKNSTLPAASLLQTSAGASSQLSSRASMRMMHKMLASQASAWTEAKTTRYLAGPIWHKGKFYQDFADLKKDDPSVRCIL